MTDNAQPSTENAKVDGDVTRSSSSADIRRRMMYVRERLKDLRIERERLIAERDGLKEELERRGSQAGTPAQG